MKEVIKKLLRESLFEGELKPENFKKNYKYQEALINQRNSQLKKKVLKDISDLIKVDGSGVYELYRGSKDANENAGSGIYADGTHYTNDIGTAKEFGDIYSFQVKLENPKIINRNEVNSLGNNSIERTDNLIKLGFDSLVIKHKKILTVNGFGGYTFDLPYLEYEVIKFKKSLKEGIDINTKKQYIGQCDLLRRKCTDNEEYWQAMMKNRKKISFEDFLASVDMRPMLDDEDEDPIQYIKDSIRQDPETAAYSSVWGNKPAMFLQVAGFEFIFV